MHVERDAQKWAQQTFGGCELGDKRRAGRLVEVEGRLSSNVGEVLSSVCRGDSAANEGAYRWVRNAAVESEAIASGGYLSTARDALECEELLAAEDTTTLSWGHGGSRELGDIGGSAGSKKRGFMVHSVLLLDSGSGSTVGLIEQDRWCREKSKRGQRHKRKERAYEKKESFKWEPSRVSSRLGELKSRVISVCDREADVYEYLMYKSGESERYVVRSSWDRRISEQWGRLREQLGHTEKLGEETVLVEQRGGRRSSTAQLELRACRVTVRAPQRARRVECKEVEMNAVIAQERDVPSGENGLCWVLLTSEGIESLSAVRRVLRIYRLRWRVEDYDKTWKSGTKVEERRMRGADNLERIAVVLSFVAIRLLQLKEVFVAPQWMHAQSVEAKEQRAKEPCTQVLSDSEWQVLWLAQERSRPPSEVPTMRWAYETLGKLGGLDRRPTHRKGRLGGGVEGLV
jgi:hypothetical protein